MTEFLPNAFAKAVENDGRLTREFRESLRRAFQTINGSVESLSERQRETLAILNALGAEDVEALQALGPLLDGKQDASAILDQLAAILGIGLVARTGTGFRTRDLQPVAGETTVSNGGGLAGDPAVGLADVANSGTGSLLAITRDAKGRVSGTKAATITGTAGRVTVANGDAVAGLPTVDLATVSDGGGGTLLRIVRDAWGRITGTSTPTTTDLAEGTNLYHTAQRVRDTVLTGLSTATNAVITATDTVLTALGKLQAQISGLIVQTITDGDTTHAPSGDAVFDALAGKAPLASPALTGEVTVNSSPVGSPVAYSIAASGDTRADFYGSGKSPLDEDNAPQFVFWGRALAALPSSVEKRIGALSFNLKGATAGHRGGLFKVTVKRNNSTSIIDALVVDETAIAPGADNAFTGGSAALRYSELFAANSVINTSDAREKSEPRDLDAAELACAADLARLPSIFQWLAAIAERGEAARLHCGPTVQSVIACMKSHGLDPFRYGFVCYDEWGETPEVKDEETGEVTQEYRPAGDRYSLRPSELAWFVIRGQEARLAALEKLTEKLTVQ